MEIHLTKPQLREFIVDQVKSGRFASAEEAVEAAVERMMLEPDDDLDKETIDAINRAEEQIDRGEGIDFNQFKAEMRRKMAAG